MRLRYPWKSSLSLRLCVEEDGEVYMARRQIIARGLSLGKNHSQLCCHSSIFGKYELTFCGR
jgi:hypothetical protein